MFFQFSYTQHCFTANRPVQYPNEVVLVSCMHLSTSSRPVQHPSGFTSTSHSSFIDLFYFLKIYTLSGVTLKIMIFIIFFFFTDLIRIF
jgi:hypothetical protein